MADHRDVAGWLEKPRSRFHEATAIITPHGVAFAPKNAVELTAAMARAVLKP